MDHQEIKVLYDPEAKGSSNNKGSEMSKEEVKILEELEEIERDLECEIKDQIYCLALRLQHLYQRQNHNNSEISISINIQTAGSTKVEIHELKNKKKKKEPRNNIHIQNSHHHHRPHHPDDNGNSKGKRFDWANSLRSGPTKTDNLSVVLKINKNKQKKATENKHTGTALSQSTGSQEHIKRSDSKPAQLTWK